MEIDIEKRRLIGKILAVGLQVARHEQKGPANYVKLPINTIDIGENLAGMRVEKDSSLLTNFVVGRDCDNFEIYQQI